MCRGITAIKQKPIVMKVINRHIVNNNNFLKHFLFQTCSFEEYRLYYISKSRSFKTSFKTAFTSTVFWKTSVLYFNVMVLLTVITQNFNLLVICRRLDGGGRSKSTMKHINLKVAYSVCIISHNISRHCNLLRDILVSRAILFKTKCEVTFPRSSSVGHVHFIWRLLPFGCFKAFCVLCKGLQGLF